MRITRTAAARSCAICERSLLMGERVVRDAPHVGGDLVDVCALCEEEALETGWLKEGAPTTPLVAETGAAAVRSTCARSSAPAARRRTRRE